VIAEKSFSDCLKMINWDVNATYGLDEEAVQYALTLTSKALNPSSIHRGGQKAKALLERARENIKFYLNCDSQDDLIFTSGATESNMLLVNGMLLRHIEEALPVSSNKNDVSKVIACCSLQEHQSISLAINRFKNFGFNTAEFTIGSTLKGSNFEGFLEKITESSKLCSCTLAQNETGEVINFREFLAKVKGKNKNLVFHSDATQVLGKKEFNFKQLGVDSASLAGHKVGSLRGVGILILKEGIKDIISPLSLGGAQENRIRAGTENIVAITSLGVILEKLQHSFESRVQAMKETISCIRKILQDAIPSCRILDFEESLPNTLAVLLPGFADYGIKGSDLVIASDMNGIYISSGSACSSGKTESPKVLEAMGFSKRERACYVRISVDHTLNTQESKHYSEKLAQTFCNLYQRHAK
jgi:cysteine desulfurase